MTSGSAGAPAQTGDKSPHQSWCSLARDTNSFCTCGAWKHLEHRVTFTDGPVEMPIGYTVVGEYLPAGTPVVVLVNQITGQMFVRSALS